MSLNKNAHSISLFDLEQSNVSMLNLKFLEEEKFKLETELKRKLDEKNMLLKQLNQSILETSILQQEVENKKYSCEIEQKRFAQLQEEHNNLTKEVNMEKQEFKQIDQLIEQKKIEFQTEYDKFSYQVKETNLNFFDKTNTIFNKSDNEILSELNKKKQQLEMELRQLIESQEHEAAETNENNIEELLKLTFKSEYTKKLFENEQKYFEEKSRHKMQEINSLNQ